MKHIHCVGYLSGNFFGPMLAGILSRELEKPRDGIFVALEPKFALGPKCLGFSDPFSFDLENLE
ncbi:MAG: hypothetical protein WBZ19_19065 [Chthoniobacterales bacterium]